MARFTFASPRGLVLVFAIGGGISVALMLGSIWLTERQTAYSDAINNAGRLRYLTERFGSSVMTEKVFGADAQLKGRSLPSSEQVFQDAHNLCSELMGEVLHDESKSRAPEIPEVSIRNELSSWQRKLDGLKQMGSTLMDNNQTELLLFKASVVETVDSIDNIVNLLTDQAQDWIRIMLVVHFVRMAWHAVFYFVLIMVFRRIWFPFVKTFNELQSLQQQQHSLLRSDFDAVVGINIAFPFEIRRGSDAFDDLVGKPMSGVSILEAASNDNAKTALEDFLKTGVSQQTKPSPPASQRSSILNRLRETCTFGICAWPIMDVETTSYDCPLAPKINSKWNCDVELLIVGKAFHSEGESIALLAVRQLGEALREYADSGKTSPRTSPPTDFHSWSKAIHENAKRDEPENARRDEPSTQIAPETIGNVESQLSTASPGMKLGGAVRGNSPTASNSSLSSMQKHYAKRKLIGLNRTEVTLGQMSELQSYTLIFDDGFDSDDMMAAAGSSSKSAGGLPDFISCLVGKTRTAFVRWWQESVNTMLYQADLTYLDYEGEVWFRPPTVACVSSQVVFCAESARIVMSSKDSEDDCEWTLQFYGISQLIKCKYPANQSTSKRLPALQEV